MKQYWHFLLLVAPFLLAACNDKSRSAGLSTSSLSVNDNAGMNASSVGVIGEWEQLHTIFDKNGNNLLDSEEQDNPSATKIGDYYLRFYPNGKCEYSNLKMEGSYEVKTEDGAKVIHITGGDPRRMRIILVDDAKMILAPSGAPGTFLVYQRI